MSRTIAVAAIAVCAVQHSSAAAQRLSSLPWSATSAHSPSSCASSSACHRRRLHRTGGVPLSGLSTGQQRGIDRQADRFVVIGREDHPHATCPDAGPGMAAAVLRGRCVTGRRSCRPDALQVLRRPAFHGGRGLRSTSHRGHVARGHDRRGLRDLRTCVAGTVEAVGNADRPIRISRYTACGVGDCRYSVTLLRVPYPESFRLVVASTRLENLAHTASAAAVQLDKAEAPQREIDRQKNEASDLAAAQEKTKSENKAQFKP